MTEMYQHFQHPLGPLQIKRIGRHILWFLLSVQLVNNVNNMCYFSKQGTTTDVTGDGNFLFITHFTFLYSILQNITLFLKTLHYFYKHYIDFTIYILFFKTLHYFLQTLHYFYKLYINFTNYTLFFKTLHYFFFKFTFKKKLRYMIL